MGGLAAPQTPGALPELFDIDQDGLAPEIEAAIYELEHGPDVFQLTDAEDGSSVYSFAADDRIWYLGEEPSEDLPENGHEIDEVFDASAVDTHTDIGEVAPATTSSSSTC